MFIYSLPEIYVLQIDARLEPYRRAYTRQPHCCATFARQSPKLSSGAFFIAYPIAFPLHQFSLALAKVYPT
jgi:hypothetical protein